MERKFSVVIIGLVFAGFATGSNGCREDIKNGDDGFRLAGNYTGVYSIQVIDGVDTLVDASQYVTFVFGRSTYTMNLNEALQDKNDLFFCNVAGNYRLENGVIFDETDGNLTQDVCTPDHNPRGAFGLVQNTGTDTITMTGDFNDSLGIRSVKTLKLVLDS